MRVLMPGAEYGAGFIPFQEKAVAAVSCVVLAVSAVLLFPLVRGGRGLDLKFLGRNFTTLLAGTVIALAAHVPISYVYDNARALPLPDLIRLNSVFRYHWVLTDAGVLLCAWYVHGRLTDVTGGRVSAPGRSLAIGLGTMFFALIQPGLLLNMARVPMGIPLDSVLHLLFVAWFYGSLDEVERARPSV
jgi:hypothetical protein